MAQKRPELVKAGIYEVKIRERISVSVEQNATVFQAEVVTRELLKQKAIKALRPYQVRLVGTSMGVLNELGTMNKVTPA